MSATRHKLNIGHGILDLEQLAGTLSNLIDRLDQQTDVITELERRISTLVTQQSFQDGFVQVQNALGQTNVLIETVALASSTKIDGKT
jgi:hypothetical protein